MDYMTHVLGIRVIYQNAKISFPDFIHSRCRVQKAALDGKEIFFVFEKEYFLCDRITFILDDKQIYLPFLAVYLQERCDGEKGTDRDTAVRTVIVSLLRLLRLQRAAYC